MLTRCRQQALALCFQLISETSGDREQVSVWRETREDPCGVSRCARACTSPHPLPHCNTRFASVMVSRDRVFQRAPPARPPPEASTAVLRRGPDRGASLMGGCDCMAQRGLVERGALEIVAKALRDLQEDREFQAQACRSVSGPRARCSARRAALHPREKARSLDVALLLVCTAWCGRPSLGLGGSVPLLGGCAVVRCGLGCGSRVMCAGWR